jgi:hypothetical protein
MLDKILFYFKAFESAAFLIFLGGISNIDYSYQIDYPNFEVGLTTIHIACVSFGGSCRRQRLLSLFGATIVWRY